jgi:hypothetical protein
MIAVIADFGSFVFHQGIAQPATGAFPAKP